MTTANPFARPPETPQSTFGRIASTVGKSLLGMTGIGMIPLGIMEHERARQRDERARRDLATGTGLIAEGMASAGSDPTAQHAAIVNVIRQISANPGVIVDNPDLVPSLLKQAQALAAPQPTIETMRPGDQMVQISPDQQTVTPMAAIPPEPTPLQEKVAMYRETYGLSQQDAVKRAMGELKLAQITDPFTRESYPVMVDMLAGSAHVLGGPAAGSRLSPEELQVLRDAGRIEGEISGSSVLSDMEQTEKMSGAEAVAVGSGAAASATRTLSNMLSSLFVDGVQDQTLLDAKAATQDLVADLTTYARDEAGTARLTGVSEMNVYRDMGPKLDWNVSREENITNLIRLRARLEDDRTRAQKYLQGPHSPEFAKAVEQLVETQDGLMARIGSREELAAARAYIKENPQETKRIFDVISKALGKAPEAVARAKQELSAVEVPTGGVPEDAFAKLVEKARTAPDSITDEELDALSPEQLDQLEAAVADAQ